jgi:CRISPR/Cas system CSM-associated protein Csm4 (group 5 of RAMP superfamily)
MGQRIFNLLLQRASIIKEVFMTDKLLLRLPERALWARAQSNEIPSFKIGKSRFFSIDKLKEWIDANFSNERSEK